MIVTRPKDIPKIGWCLFDMEGRIAAVKRIPIKRAVLCEEPCDDPAGFLVVEIDHNPVFSWVWCGTMHTAA